MKSTPIFLIALFLSLYSHQITHVTATSLLERYQIISPVKKSLKEVLVSVKSKLKSGSPLDSILKMLDTLKSDVSDEQYRHDNVYKDQMSECEDEYKFRSQQVDDSTTTLEKSLREMNSCNGTRIKDYVDYKVNLATQQQTQENLDTLESQISQAETEFKTKQDDHNDAIDALKSCVDILDQLFIDETPESNSFIELAKSTSILLLTSAKIHSTRHYSSLLSIMAQISSQRDILTDNTALEKIRELLTHLKDNVLQSFQDYQNEENKIQQELTDRKVILQEYLTSLQESEKKLMKNIEEMDSCLSLENSIISAASDKKERNEGLMDSAKSMCDNFENEYKEATEARFILF